MSRSIAVALRAHETSPAIARAHVAGLINGHSAPEQRGIAVLVVSELVTNAVMHGREPIRLQAEIDRNRLHIQVFDADPHADAVVPPAPGDAETSGGRGLRIVAALTHRWGVTPGLDGKCVWATLRV